MPLIQCPDCNHKVSDTAPTCPHCGRPLAAQTIEMTGKKIKKLQILSFTLVILGLLPTIAKNGDSTAGLLMILAGVVLYVAARVSKWWQHE
ncbi:hypothetical protein GGQ74_001134 [Desulfobaculum xiamenense]|uniref:Zinc-ribbon domain-containing protein n=1 Tax=Desulfobaculum xiamenense TaxID=995050 RepID=A0A846QQK7_9BACT|nr:zinc ribbon domain-containing protein [Desulfobaculum xiamenense]NJB67494.1 hypothetical protein [Desulfobaculum xiamenense]